MSTVSQPTDCAPWPSHFASPAEILAWLNKLQAKDGLTAKCLLGMRWLVLAELDRSVPEPAKKMGFTHAEPNLFSQKLPDATTLQ